MTIKQIEAAAAKQTIKYETAKKIRAILDAARQEYGADLWDEDDMRTETLELVTEQE